MAMGFYTMDLPPTFTKAFFPDRLYIEQDRLRIKRWRWFGLTSDEEEIKLSRIASVRLNKGLFTGKVIIETAGGSMHDIVFDRLWRRKATKIAVEIRDML